MTSYHNPNQVAGVFLSSEVHSPFTVELCALDNLGLLFSKRDLAEVELEKKRFALLSNVENSFLYDEKQVTEGERFNPLSSHSLEFLRTLHKSHTVQKPTNKPLPLLFFLNARLFHGPKILDSSNNIVISMKNTNCFQDQKLYFANHTISSLPLETRIVFEISALYNNSFLKKLGICATSLFDYAGIMRTGNRVQAIHSGHLLLQARRMGEHWPPPRRTPARECPTTLHHSQIPKYFPLY